MMTQEEIKKRAYEVYPEDMRYIPQDPYAPMEIDYNKQLREGYIKALTELESLPKIHGWVARDMGPLNALDLNIGKLKLFSRKPIRNAVGCFWRNNYPQDGERISLPTELIPELKWEDEPIEVELLIRKI